MAVAKTLKKYGRLAVPLACYSLFSLFPSYTNANNVQEAETKPTTPSALELKIDYEKSLKRTNKDYKLNSLEIEELHGKLSAYLEFKDKSVVEGADVSKPGKDLEEKVVVTGDDILAPVVRDFKLKILCDYPYIFSNGYTISYDAFMVVKKSDELRTIIGKAELLTSGAVPDSLMHKKYYDTRDLFRFNDFINLYNKQNIKITEHSKPQDSIFTSELDLTDAQFKEINEIYNSYLDAREKEFSRAKKFWSVGVDQLDSKSKIGFLGDDYLTDEIRFNLKSALELQHYAATDVQGFYVAESFKNRFSDYHLGGGWMFLLGLGFPFLRTWLTTKYMRREYDFLDFGENMISTIGCGAVLDAIHPLIFPIRLVAIPFIMEPMRKIFNIYDK
ncbi:MAG: hypothetical protein KKA79_01475 [Nanoarchaeota archaeon]|nr:hypothetical protein [Nanoarchaeota archaeon]MCG2718683.1 hypothetical protein [Nanoarchaeota archaeon]